MKEPFSASVFEESYPTTTTYTVESNLEFEILIEQFASDLAAEGD
jgi:hypothetical protein